ncbi:hypothetical protein LS482_09285 [Sinomicrobium kalidii]|uniref:hypothetical protein n=1 Tax=Sinomicrobium kalidii TaxID=2900738 RepID=UPI001E58B2AF|nr:hypothetical protein [Sinomicrobium kalidii]UGU18060.1 hypothetical protein LS482_09285 [Sinomicrobium kalidii]
MKKVYKIIAVFVLILITGILSFIHYIDNALDQKEGLREVRTVNETSTSYTKIF